MALERIAGRLPDHAYIYFLRRNEAIPADLSPLALQATAEPGARISRRAGEARLSRSSPAITACAARISAISARRR